MTAEIKRLCKRRTCAQDRPCPVAACARRATSTADKKSRAERIKRWCRPVLVDAGAGGANLRTSGLLELRTSSLVKHSPENLHLLLDHICGGVTANSVEAWLSRSQRSSISLNSCISWDCWRMRAEARASLLINPRVGFVHTQARISAQRASSICDPEPSDLPDNALTIFRSREPQRGVGVDRIPLDPKPSAIRWTGHRLGLLIPQGDGWARWERAG